MIHKFVLLIIASALTVPLKSTSMQTKGSEGVAVCIEQIGTVGNTEESQRPLLIGDSMALLEECRKDASKVTQERGFPREVSPAMMATLVKELDVLQSAHDTSRKPLGTFAFVVITPDEKRTLVLNKAQTISVVNDLLLVCREPGLTHDLRELKAWILHLSPARVSLGKMPSGKIRQDLRLRRTRVEPEAQGARS